MVWIDSLKACFSMNEKTIFQVSVLYLFFVVPHQSLSMQNIILTPLGSEFYSACFEFVAVSLCK
jgi:hypothetical protein